MFTSALWVFGILFAVGAYRIYGQPVLTAFVLGLAGDSYTDHKHDWD